MCLWNMVHIKKSQKVEIFSFLSPFTIVVGTHDWETWMDRFRKVCMAFQLFNCVKGAPVKVGIYAKLVGKYCQNIFLWYFKKLAGWYLGLYCPYHSPSTAIYWYIMTSLKLVIIDRSWNRDALYFLVKLEAGTKVWN